MSVGVGLATLVAVPLSAGPATAADPWCTTDMLSLTARLRPDSDSTGQGSLGLILTNTASQPCVTEGFPGVDLLGPDDPAYGSTYHLPRQSAATQPLTLAPGQSAESDITYLPGGPQGWYPNTILLTPPDTTTQLNTPWPQGISVLRQDAATHPGTFIGPLQPS
ncbi:DUF4232 domain-containing protein [Nocardia sp. NPDC004722]